MSKTPLEQEIKRQTSNASTASDSGRSGSARGSSSARLVYPTKEQRLRDAYAARWQAAKTPADYGNQDFDAPVTSLRPLPESPSVSASAAAANIANDSASENNRSQVGEAPPAEVPSTVTEVREVGSLMSRICRNLGRLFGR